MEGTPSWLSPSEKDVRAALVKGTDVDGTRRRVSRIEKAIAMHTGIFGTWLEFWTYHYRDMAKVANAVKFDDDFRQVANGC